MSSDGSLLPFAGFDPDSDITAEQRPESMVTEGWRLAGAPGDTCLPKKAAPPPRGEGPAQQEPAGSGALCGVWGEGLSLQEPGTLYEAPGWNPLALR